jgi:hypothetical protein
VRERGRGRGGDGDGDWRGGWIMVSLCCGDDSDGDGGGRRGLAEGGVVNKSTSRTYAKP